jgi:hypothetical protein
VQFVRGCDGKRNDVPGTASNNRMNAPVRTVTPLAVASGAPVRPARYALR